MKRSLWIITVDHLDGSTPGLYPVMSVGDPDSSLNQDDYSHATSQQALLEVMHKVFGMDRWSLANSRLDSYGPYEDIPQL